MEPSSYNFNMPKFPNPDRPLRMHVLNKESAETGARYWQIIVQPTNDGERIKVQQFGGEVFQPDPNFKADNDDAEYSTFPTIEAAFEEADAERDRLIADGWTLHPGGPTLL